MSADKNEHLNEVLQSHKLSHIDSFVAKFKTKRTEVSDKLKEHYGASMYNVYNSGSFAKHTAVNIKFDMDILAPFKHDSFNTLEDMFNDVYDFLYNEYKDEAAVRKQKVSIGIEWPIEEGDDKPVQIDVVPGREQSEQSYSDDHSVNLYINKDHWGESAGSYKKTNIQDQIENIKGKDEERKIIRLLKVWKNNQSRDGYKSFALELFSIKALSDYSGENKLWDKLKYTMEFIRDHVNEDGYQLTDPGNSNNNVLDGMKSDVKSNLSSDMRNIIDRIDENEEQIKFYFPINEQYSVSQDEGFGKKEEKKSTPTKAVRFG